MSDQGKWFKLHCGWDDDPHIDALSDADQLRWVKFGTYMKEHGTDGKMVIVEPARNLQTKFRLTSFEEVINVLRKFPNYVVGEKQNSPSHPVTCVTVTINNWQRYQGDFSRDRMRKLRTRVTAKKRGEEKRRDVEEKRREENIPPTPQKVPFQKPTPQEATAYAKSIGFRMDGEAFCAHYEARGWKFTGGVPMKDWKAAVVTWKKNAPPAKLIAHSLPYVPSVPDKPMTEDEQKAGLAFVNQLKKTLAGTAKEMPK